MTDKERKERPYELLNALLEDKSVSRWDISIWRKELRRIIREEEKYNTLHWRVEELIESANESR